MNDALVEGETAVDSGDDWTESAGVSGEEGTEETCESLSTVALKLDAENPLVDSMNGATADARERLLVETNCQADTEGNGEGVNQGRDDSEQCIQPLVDGDAVNGCSTIAEQSQSFPSTPLDTHTCQGGEEAGGG